jgi:hypothetical protein
MSVSDRHGDCRSENTRGGGQDWYLGDEDSLKGGHATGVATRRDHEANRDRTGDSSDGRKPTDRRETCFHSAADISSATMSVLQRAPWLGHR